MRKVVENYLLELLTESKKAGRGGVEAVAEPCEDWFPLRHKGDSPNVRESCYTDTHRYISQILTDIFHRYSQINFTDKFHRYKIL